jgi:hypothetical protein
VKEQINSSASPGKQKYVVKGLYLQPSWSNLSAGVIMNDDICC